MARNRKKVSLYEAISKSSPKSGFGRPLRKLQPEEPDSAEPTTAKTAIPASGRAAYWPTKPKIVQFNAGRIEISLPYQLAIALLLGLVLLVLVGVRLGQSGYLRNEGTGSSDKKLNNRSSKETNIGNKGKIDENKASDIRETKTVEAKGDHRIVIQTFQARADLVPVQEYFAQCGIEAEIRKIRDSYFLVTSKKYENPNRPGTDGYVAKQEIIRLGAQYKAPVGVQTFAPNLFSDAYGMKFED